MEKIENIENKMATLIFLSKDPLIVEELAKFYGLSLDETQEILSMLKEKRKESGINIRIENGAVFLVSNPLYGEDVKKFFNPELKIKKLTKPTMETLAIIAYKGPVTKGEIEQIKGVSVEKTISGKKKAIGTPNLYEVTEDFYSYLNISEKSELPGYSQYEKIELLYKENEGKDSEKPGIIEEIKEKTDKKESIEVENEIE